MILMADILDQKTASALVPPEQKLTQAKKLLEMTYED